MAIRAHSSPSVWPLSSCSRSSSRLRVSSASALKTLSIRESSSDRTLNVMQAITCMSRPRHQRSPACGIASSGPVPNPERDPRVRGQSGPAGYRSCLLRPAVRGEFGGDPAPEADRGLVLVLEGDLPGAGMPEDDLAHRAEADARAPRAAHHEKAVQDARRPGEAAYEREAHGPLLPFEQVRLPTGLRER